MKLLTIGEHIVALLSDGYIETEHHFNNIGNILIKEPNVSYTVVDIFGEPPEDFAPTTYIVRDGKLVYSETFKAENFKRYSNKIRAERDLRLSESDWTQLPDTFVGEDELKSECANYRQLVRSVTEQTGFPFEVEWPVRPAPLKLLKITQRLGGM